MPIMSMKPRLRRFTLTAHVTFSVGWLGAVLAYLVLAVTGLTNSDQQLVRAAYLAMELIGWYVIVPLSLASLFTGLVQALGTDWGLFRHYWILTKFLLTLVGTIILLVHMKTAVSSMARAAAEGKSLGADLSKLPLSLVIHAIGGLLVLLTATALSLYKPWGRTPYGRHMQQEKANAVAPNQTTAITTPWARYVLIGLIGLIVLFVVMHLTGGGPRH